MIIFGALCNYVVPEKEDFLRKKAFRYLDRIDLFGTAIRIMFSFLYFELLSRRLDKSITILINLQAI